MGYGGVLKWEHMGTSLKLPNDLDDEPWGSPNSLQAEEVWMILV